MTTQAYTRTLTVIACAQCSMIFGITAEFEAARREDHVSFTCPAGHKQGFYADNEAERLAKQLSNAKQRLNRAEARETSTRDQLQATERSLRGHKAAKTRIKNRIAAGVCPCCNRSFENVSRHMAGRHPDFAHTDAEGGQK